MKPSIEETARLAVLEVENARLMKQVEAMSGDAHILREAAPWRDATPEERLTATWALSRLVPWFRAQWPADVAERACRREPLPADTLALLERMRAQSRPR